jgi:hypothetical protein
MLLFVMISMLLGDKSQVLENGIIVDKNARLSLTQIAHVVGISKGLIHSILNPLSHEHIVKNGHFHKKPPVTSSNCYETMKNASILIKLGANFDWTIAFVTTCSVLSYHGNEGTSQNCQKSLFCLYFFHQNLFQSAATSQGIETESKAFQRWLHITL